MQRDITSSSACPQELLKRVDVAEMRFWSKQLNVLQNIAGDQSCRLITGCGLFVKTTLFSPERSTTYTDI